ncbi:hypothetical protein [Pseudomonas sp. B10(2017)]|uniref:hypothetical protein n=1 Tax=Pseudomonas sp. B10(2017) TaxID=1981749 RepID=UPI0021146C4C|nr:hypothetical protein [Pseudomonas sp. B10(2017)]
MPDQNRDDDLHIKRIKRLQTEIADSRRMGLAVRFMHMSALSPSSRPSHVARHGKLFTGEEMLEWWATSDNSKGCRCSFAMVPVTANGRTLVPGLLTRAKAMLKKYKQQHP